MNVEIFHTLESGQRTVRFTDIPVSAYGDFVSAVSDALKETAVLPLAYFAVRDCLCIVLMDYASGRMSVGLCRPDSERIPTSGLDQLYQFEREIHESCGILFEGHPYLKPLKRPGNESFGFDPAPGKTFHEVNVGPVHAGIIEPGRFLFKCSGEKVVSMEVCLGYQHRGIEKIISESDSALQRMLLAEHIAGDSVIANSIAMASALDNGNSCPLVNLERTLALEMERVAMHLADIAALSGDCAYQFGQISAEPLRTSVVNLMMQWTGSRSGRSLVRPYGMHGRLTLEMTDMFREAFERIGKQLSDISFNMLNSPSLLSRLEGKCTLLPSMARRFGVRGTVAKASAVVADLRTTEYATVEYPDSFSPVKLSGGDLLSRLRIRLMEAEQSIFLIMDLLKRIKARWFEKMPNPSYECHHAPDSVILSPVEGFRGTILHVAITDVIGDLTDYWIFDPSVLEWPVLAYVMRGQQISDFPVCNKSFNLSYLANDL